MYVVGAEFCLALTEAEKAEEGHSVDSVLKELAIDAEKIPAEPLEGRWE